MADRVERGHPDRVWISPHPTPLPDDATGVGMTLSIEQLRTALSAAEMDAAEYVQIHQRNQDGRLKIWTWTKEPDLNDTDEDPAHFIDRHKIGIGGTYE